MIPPILNDQKSWFFLAIDAGSSCSYNFLRALSFASLRGTFVYKLFTSRDITFSLGSRLMLSKIFFAFIELVLMFAPSIFSKNFARQLEYRSQWGICFMNLRQSKKPDWLPPSRPHPFVKILTFSFFPQSQQFLIDIFSQGSENFQMFSVAFSFCC